MSLLILHVKCAVFWTSVLFPFKLTALTCNLISSSLPCLLSFFLKSLKLNKNKSSHENVFVTTQAKRPTHETQRLTHALCAGPRGVVLRKLVNFEKYARFTKGRIAVSLICKLSKPVKL